MLHRQFHRDSHPCPLQRQIGETGSSADLPAAIIANERKV